MINLNEIHFQTAPSNLFQTDNVDNGFCACCGRRLLEGSGYTVCVAEGGDILVDTKFWDSPAVTTDNGYMGIFDIGPECAKGIKSHYKVKRG